MKRRSNNTKMPGNEVQDCYVLFPGHTDGMCLYRALRRAEVGARIAPTPRALRSSCGMSLLVLPADEHKVIKIASACGATIEKIARLPRQIDPFRDTFC